MSFPQMPMRGGVVDAQTRRFTTPWHRWFTEIWRLLTKGITAEKQVTTPTGTATVTIKHGLIVGWEE